MSPSGQPGLSIAFCGGKKEKEKKEEKSEQKKLAAARDWVACSGKWISRRNQRCGARGNKNSNRARGGEEKREGRRKDEVTGTETTG